MPFEGSCFDRFLRPADRHVPVSHGLRRFAPRTLAERPLWRDGTPDGSMGGGNRVGCHRRDGPLLGMIHRALAPDRGEPRLLHPRPARRAIIVV